MSSASPKSRKYKSLLNALLYVSGVFVLTFVLTELLLYSQNYLLLNRNWIASKGIGEIPVVAWNETLVTRFTLAGNKLNLGSWYGFQEFLSAKSVHPQELRFNFQIPEDSYLDIIYNKTSDSSYGVRISRRLDVPSMSFVSDNLRRFKSKSRVLLPEIGNGQHSAILAGGPLGTHLSIDQQKPIWVGPSFSTGQIGFRSGMLGAVIDDVEGDTSEGPFIRDSFQNNRSFWSVFIFHLILTFFVLEFFFLLARWTKRKPFRQVPQMRALVIYVLCAMTTLGYLFDFYYWSRFPFRTNFRIIYTRARFTEEPLEEFRHKVFSHWASILGIESNLREEILAEYGIKRSSSPALCDSNGCRNFWISNAESWGKRNPMCFLIVYIGGSQTYGEGGGMVSDLFFERIQRDLSHSGKKYCVETVNFGRSRFNLSEHQDILNSGILETFTPDLVVMNISNNDTVEILEKYVPIFVARFREKNSRIVLLEEANSVENQKTLAHILQNHRVLRAIGQRERVPVFRSHDYLARIENRNGGFMWWDQYHLAPFGQLLLADWLKPIVENELDHIPIHSKRRVVGSN